MWREKTLELEGKEKSKKKKQQLKAMINAALQQPKARRADLTWKQVGLELEEKNIQCSKGQ